VLNCCKFHGRNCWIPSMAFILPITSSKRIYSLCKSPPLWCYRKCKLASTPS
jgi:hypothetical protein